MANRVNTQHELKAINNRIDGVVEQMGGVDVVFRPSECIGFDELNALISDTTLAWLNTGIISEAFIYGADVSSSDINNLRPFGMLKYHVAENNGGPVADVYRPLESFTKYADGSMLFIQNHNMSDIERYKWNYGGNIQNIIVSLIDSSNSETPKQDIVSAVLSSEYFNIDSLYFIQNTDLVFRNFGSGAYTESYTLHFE